MKTQVAPRSSPRRLRILVLILTILSAYALISTAGIELLPAFLPGLQLNYAHGMSGGLSPVLVNVPLPITGWVATILVAAPWAALGLLFIALLVEIARRSALESTATPAPAGTPATSQRSSSSGWWIGALSAMMLIALIAGINVSNMAWAVAQNDPGETILRRVAMVSATEGWAVGDGGFLHYTHGIWKLIPRPQNNFSELVRGVALVPGNPNET